MSDQRIVPTAVSHANCATRWTGSLLARSLHGYTAIRALVFSMMFAGCIIPPSLSVDTTDAGLNSPPSIISVRADGVELPEWSEVNFAQGGGTINLTVYDTDLDDILQPKIFVNYHFDDPTPPRITCLAVAGHTVERSSTCDLNGLCQNADVANPEPATMQIIVFDRQIIEGQPPVYQAMTEGGLSTSRTFSLRCQKP